jgi:hypothetical protein
MAELSTGGAGENGVLTVKTEDDQVAARLSTTGVVAAPGAGGRRHPGGIGDPIGLGGGAIVGIVGTPRDSFELGHAGRAASVVVRGVSGDPTIQLTGGDVADGPADLTVGGGSHPGRLRVVAAGGQAAVSVTSDATGVMAELGGNGRIGRMRLLDDQGRQRVAFDATLGQIFLDNEAGGHMVILDAQSGDVILAGADCAEEFTAAGADLPAPGTVLVLDDGGTVRESTEPYDRKVAGVVSGAGAFRPGLVLDRRDAAGPRVAIALIGKVFCKADASYAPIQLGDLLTTSPTPGHAMAATDQQRAFGAVIGKALGGLDSGQGFVPVMVALR